MIDKSSSYMVVDKWRRSRNASAICQYLSLVTACCRNRPTISLKSIISVLWRWNRARCLSNSSVQLIPSLSAGAGLFSTGGFGEWFVIEVLTATKISSMLLSAKVYCLLLIACRDSENCIGKISLLKKYDSIGKRPELRKYRRLIPQLYQWSRKGPKISSQPLENIWRYQHQVMWRDSYPRFWFIGLLHSWCLYWGRRLSGAYEIWYLGKMWAFYVARNVVALNCWDSNAFNSLIEILGFKHWCPRLRILVLFLIIFL